MTLRLTIVSPRAASAADLRRQQQRDAPRVLEHLGLDGFWTPDDPDR